MLKRFLLFVLFSTVVLSIGIAATYANAAPIEGSKVHASGNIQQLQKNNISLEEELIYIQLDGFYANVHVHYRYFNAGPHDKVTYGFPLDEYILRWDTEGSFSQFRIIDETGELTTTETMEANPKVEKKKGYHSIQRRWFVSEVDFPANAEKTVQVSYRVKNFHWGKFTRDRLTTFTYYLKPSQNWGNGVVKKFRVIVDARKNIDEGTVMKTMNLPFYDYGGVYVYEADKFDLSKAENLEVVYDETNKYELINMRDYTRLIKEKAILSVRASSALAGNYNADNLSDGDLNTAWVEGVAGNGKGEWVEIEFNDVYLDGIGIINGYTKNGETYSNNSRVKKLKFEIYRKDGSTSEQIMELPNRDYRALNKVAFLPFLDRHEFSFRKSSAITKIRMTILEVYPGTEYQDTCISELFFYAN